MTPLGKRWLCSGPRIQESRCLHELEIVYNGFETPVCLLPSGMFIMHTTSCGDASLRHWPIWRVQAATVDAIVLSVLESLAQAQTECSNTATLILENMRIPAKIIPRYRDLSQQAHWFDWFWWNAFWYKVTERLYLPIIGSSLFRALFKAAMALVAHLIQAALRVVTNICQPPQWRWCVSKGCRGIDNKVVPCASKYFGKVG